MTLRENIEAFAELGQVLRDSLEGKATPFTSEIEQLISTQYKKNPWFTPENVRYALKANADLLTVENLTLWTDRYPGLYSVRQPLKAGVVMAGNIPLVGFHDFISVLISGNDIIARTSSKDSDSIQLIRDILYSIDPYFRKRILITEGSMAGFDVVIATGSNNSSRYFEYYFGKYPHIIRRNRNSIAIIEGDEADDELRLLGNDIFMYFGLGCRNVSKIYLPYGYEPSSLISFWEHYSSLMQHNKYINNYDFHKALYLVNREPFIDSGYLLLRQKQELVSPVAVLHYEYYHSLEEVSEKNRIFKNDIQCIIGRNNVPFGNAQSPALWDYADGADTIEFLLKKNIEGVL